VIAEVVADPARRGLVHESFDQSNTLVVGWPAVNEVAVDEEDIVVAGPLKCVVPIGSHDWWELFSFADGSECALSCVEIAVITEANDCRLLTALSKPIDAGGCTVISRDTKHSSC
jgi:hypothetical protein